MPSKSSMSSSFSDVRATGAGEPWQAGLVGLSVEPPEVDSSRFAGPPEASGEHAKAGNAFTVEPRSSKTKGGDRTPQNGETPEISRQLENISRSVDAELKAAIGSFMCKGYTALSPDEGRNSRS